MSSYRIVFTATSTSDVKLVDATVATDGGLTVVLQNGERVFAVPTANVIAIERIPEPAQDAAPTGNV